MNQHGKCTICEAPKSLIVRFLTIEDGDNIVKDRAQYCENCWNGIRRELCQLAEVSG